MEDFWYKKLAIFAKDPNIDPVGACVGNRGTRINAVVDELRGEKIDVIRWSEDVFEYIADSLSPAEVVSVEIDEAKKSSKVIVPDSKLSLAIGKNGVNVRLAVKLTGWKMDVISESKAKELENNLQNNTEGTVQTVKTTLDDSTDDLDLNIMEDLDTLD